LWRLQGSRLNDPVKPISVCCQHRSYRGRWLRA
jgi:hypothetical protein